MIGNRKRWQLPIKAKNAGEELYIHSKAKFHYFTDENKSLCGNHNQLWYVFETYPDERDWKTFDDSVYCSRCLRILKRNEGSGDE
ncbi:hypothetical protein B9W73_09525 [Lactococcus lactis]|uniref:hypothetical protein n=1 Tax=Lactococcus lactis TaxID=1358 RepID=UPI000A1EA030|nr:hypothetical protein [Lactococcus lactis]OSP86496.1 hypothetical protein B9W73_09525 [Lactococcus lactis]